MAKLKLSNEELDEPFSCRVVFSFPVVLRMRVMRRYFLTASGAKGRDRMLSRVRLRRWQGAVVEAPHMRNFAT